MPEPLPKARARRAEHPATRGAAIGPETHATGDPRLLEVALLNRLLADAQQGDRAARERLLAELRPRLLLVARVRLRDTLREQAEDVVQETLIVVTERLAVISDRPDRYALAVLRNKIGHVYRSRQRRASRRAFAATAADATAGAAVPLEELADPAPQAFPDPLLRKRIEKAFAALGTRCRTVIAMKSRGARTEEILRLFPDVKPATVYSQVSRCCKQFAGLLGMAARR